VIDTPGADLSPRAEEGALAGEIARSLADMASLTVPSVSVLLGQGSGGAALALLPADRVIAAEHGWLSPIAPEGASVIVYGTVTRAAEMAEAQGIVGTRLLEEGIVDTVVPEAGGLLVERLTVEIARALDELATEAGDLRTRRRHERYRQVGATPSSRTL
jgi:acetyl-CoA carboxylase carboxyl transferase subunit beta